MPSERLDALVTRIRDDRTAFGYARPSDIIAGFREFVRLRNEGRDMDLSDKAKLQRLWRLYKNHLQCG